MKGYYNHTGCPKKLNNDLILRLKIKTMDMLKIFGLLNSFAFGMWCICGALLSKLDRPSNARCPQMKNGLILSKNEIYGYDQNVVSPE